MKLETTVCPEVLNSSYTTSHCEFSLYYRGDSEIKFGDQIVYFTAGRATVRSEFGNQIITSAGMNCLSLRCIFSTSIASVQLITPNVQITAAGNTAGGSVCTLLLNTNTKNYFQIVLLPLCCFSFFSDLSHCRV